MQFLGVNETTVQRLSSKYVKDCIFIISYRTYWLHLGYRD